MTTLTEELSPSPYSVYPAVRLAEARYPETATWGLGQRETDPNALFAFENWAAATVNDLYALYGPDSSMPLASNVVTKVANRYNLTIPKTKIPEGEFPVFGEVNRAGSGQLVRSLPETYLVKTKRPGGLTFWASEQFHRGLILSVEGFPEGAFLNPSNSTGGLWCLINKYENARKNDIITVAYGATTIEHVVSPDEAARPGPIRVFISPTIIQTGNLYGPVGVAFMVRDVVNNTSGEKYAYSRPYILNSELDPNLLDPPIFTVDGVEASIVDLDLPSAAHFAALVTLPRKTPTPIPSNRVVLIMAITQVTEYGESTRTLRLPAVNDRNLRGESIPIDNGVFSSLMDAKISLSFEWQTAGGVVHNRSGTTVVQVVGTPALRLLAPSFDNKAGPQVVLASNYPSGAVVAVAFQGMNVAHIIKLIWTFADGTVASIPVQAGVSSGLVLFSISAQIIAKSLGQLIKLSYEVTTGTKTQSSAIQELTFQALGGGLTGTTDTVDVGMAPHSITITNDGLRAFVTCLNSHAVSVIDIRARKVIHTLFNVNTAFLSVLSPDNRRLYVSNFEGSSYTVIDTSTYRILSTVPIVGGNNPSGLAITADGSRLFVVCGKNGFVSVHDTVSGNVLGRVAVGVNPFGVAVNPEQTQVLVASTSVLDIISAGTHNALVARINGANRPAQIAFGAGTPARYAYVTDVDSVLVVDLMSNAIIQKIAGINLAWGITRNPNAPELWVSGVGPGGVGGQRDSVYIINTNTNQITKRLTGFRNTANIAFSPAAGVALVVDNASNSVSFVAL